MSKKFSGKSRVETHHFASIVVYTVIIPGRLSTYNRREEHIQWKGKLSRFRSLQNGPVKKGILQGGRATIKWGKAISQIEEAIVQAKANLSLGLKATNGIEGLYMRLHQVAQNVKCPHDIALTRRVGTDY